jgi:hypothetical protein
MSSTGSQKNAVLAAPPHDLPTGQPPIVDVSLEVGVDAPEPCCVETV